MAVRIAVIGAGAVGAYVGGGLAAAGHDVVLIDPWPAHVEAMRASGLHLSGMTPQETRTVQVRAMHVTEVQSLAKQPGIDYGIIATKSYDTEWAAAMMLQYLSPTGTLVSLQNCVNEERIAAIAGWGRVMGVVVTGGVAVDLYEPGHIRRNMAKILPSRRCKWASRTDGSLRVCANSRRCYATWTVPRRQTICGANAGPSYV